VFYSQKREIRFLNSPKFLTSSLNSFSWVGWEGETRAAPSRYPKYWRGLAQSAKLPKRDLRLAVVAPAHKSTTSRSSRHCLSRVQVQRAASTYNKKPIHSCVCVCAALPWPFISSPWSGHSRRALAADSRLDFPTARCSNQHPPPISFPEPQDTCPKLGHTPAHPPNASHLWVNEEQQTLVRLPRYAVPFHLLLECLIFDLKFEPRASSPVRARQDEPRMTC
jgi:hypothetical protein